jgi:sugar/nucleoside kinase (ribokinase family)
MDMIFEKINGENIIVKNKIGCGDIFGATFFYSYIGTHDNKQSLYIANKAGAYAASTSELFNCESISI